MEGDIGTLSPPPCLAQGDLKEADSKPIVMNTALSLSFNTDIDDALEVLSRQPQEENFFPSKDQNSSLLPLNDGRISVNPYTAPAVAPSVGSLDLRAQRVEKPLGQTCWSARLVLRGVLALAAPIHQLQQYERGLAQRSTPAGRGEAQCSAARGQRQPRDGRLHPSQCAAGGF